ERFPKDSPHHVNFINDEDVPFGEAEGQESLNSQQSLLQGFPSQYTGINLLSERFMLSPTFLKLIECKAFYPKITREHISNFALERCPKNRIFRSLIGMHDGF